MSITVYIVIKVMNALYVPVDGLQQAPCVKLPSIVMFKTVLLAPSPHSAPHVIPPMNYP